MICPKCGHENPTGTRFCGVCGTSLSIECPSCSTANPPANRFCGNCGSPLEGRPARTERRMVTVLFTDLVGFTPLAESRDPEEVREMLSTYFARSRDVVERFRGNVEKFIGDAVMAWWGALEAREDDAERAVRAALELVDMVQDLGSELDLPGLALRAGVLTGEAAVDHSGEQGVIVGDLVNTASRLQSLAEPGTVVVGESTRNLVAEAIEFKPLGEQKVKGKESPVSAYRALGVVAQRGGRGKTEGLEPPFTGRHEELRLLKDQLHATGRDQRGRLVSIVGDPGIGKTRLAWELQKYIDGIAEGIYWHQGRSPAYGDGITFWSVGEMIRGRAGIAADTDDKVKSRMKLRTMVAEYLPLAEERSWVEPRLAALLGLEEMPPGDRDELFAALRTFFYRVADLGTVVMVFEDFHWADPTVLDFITDIVDRAGRHPVLVITLSRPDLLDRHPRWGAGRRNTMSLHLAPRTDDEMSQLVSGMVPGLPADAAGQIVQRAAGIPLYAVEFVRMLLGSGDIVRDGDGYVVEGDLSTLAVPDTLAAVIGARLDRLEPSDRSLVQDAAVLGQQFTLSALAAVRDTRPDRLADDLQRLVREELFTVEDDPLSAERGRFRFVQSVIREVAYGRLSRPDRHTRHRKVAEYFVGLDDPELAGMVASHYLAAHETAPAGAGDLLKEGRTALVQAADRAHDLRSHEQALSLYRQALDLAEAPPERAMILIKATVAAAWGGDLEAAVDLGHRGIELMEAIGDSEGCYRACATLAYVLDSNFRSDEAVALLAPLYAEITDFDTPARVTLGLEMARAHMLNQVPEKSLEVADRVLPQAEHLASPGELVDGIVSKATALADVGRHTEAEALLTGAAALADQHALQPQALRALNNLAVIQSRLDPLTALRTSEMLWERTVKFGGTAWLERARLDRADYLVGLGRFEDAQEMFDAVDVEHLAPLQQGFWRGSKMMLEAVTRPDLMSSQRLLDEIATWGPVSDPQARQSVEWFKALAYRNAGEWTEMFDQAMTVAVPWAAEGALLAAVMLQDPARIRRALDEFVGHLPPGRLRTAVSKIGSGAIRYLEGDQDEGAVTVAAGLDVYERIAIPMSLAAWQAAFGALVGIDHPLASEPASRAQRWMRETGALGMEALLADGLPGDQVRERAG